MFTVLSFENCVDLKIMLQNYITTKRILNYRLMRTAAGRRRLTDPGETIRLVIGAWVLT